MKTTIPEIIKKHQLNIECSLFQTSALSQLLKKNASHRQEFSAKNERKQLFMTVGTTSTFLRLIQL